jgi:hypothetical protein
MVVVVHRLEIHINVVVQVHIMVLDVNMLLLLILVHRHHVEMAESVMLLEAPINVNVQPVMKEQHVKPEPIIFVF